MKQLDHNTITQALRTWFQPGEVFEIRVLEALTKRWNTKEHTEAGYFDYEHIDDVPRILEDTLLSYKGIYVTANPLQSSVLGRSMNRLKNEKLIGAKDEEVAARRWLLIDCDAKRVSGVSSSDEEHGHALAKAQEIKTKLGEIGWPEPIELDSGNGAQLMYRVDLPVDDEGLIKRCLDQLKLASDENVDIDQTVFNPARIWRLPGAWNCKGDECPPQTRVHRQSQILKVPQTLEAVPLDVLQAFAPDECSPSNAHENWDYAESSFDINLFVATHFPDAKPQSYQGGTKWVLDVCPFNPDHNNRSAVITQAADGRLGFRCHHNSCTGKNWHDLRSMLAPKSVGIDTSDVDMSALFEKLKQTDTHEEMIAPPPAKRSPLEPPLLTEMLSEMAKRSPDVSSMVSRAPEHAPAIIDGLFREREVVNVVAAPKTGKSWLVMGMALSIALGKKWLDFKTKQGNVYMIDNELHETAFSQRLRASLECYGISPAEVEGRLFCRCVRQYMPTLDRMLPFLDEAIDLNAKVIIIDAMYRALPKGTDENSNSDMRDFYNMLNRIADYTGAAIILVHHTSKGIQAGKTITDLGAGAGAISRAADTHIALRQHIKKHKIVFDAVTRTFSRVEPFVIHAEPPLMAKDPNEDPRFLEGLTPAEIKRLMNQKEVNDIVAIMEGQGNVDTITVEFSAEEVADVLKTTGEISKKELIQILRDDYQLGRNQARVIINEAIAEDLIQATEKKRQIFVDLKRPATDLEATSGH